MGWKIVIITDCTDVAYNELHQIVSRELENYKIMDFQIAPLVSVKNFSIFNASFSIRVLAELYPPGSVFFVVVNGTNKNPDRIFGKTMNGIIFVGNNSGYFNWMIKDFGLKWLYRNKMDRGNNSRSFGGKHVGAPTVAKIVSGISLEDIGEPVSEDFLSDFSILDGTVVYCDNFGLMKISHPKLTEFYEGQKIEISVNGEYRVDGIYATKWKTQLDGTWVLFPGSSLDFMPELGRVRAKNSADELGVGEGDVISWRAK